MNTTLTIVLAVLMAVFLGGLAVAESNSDALGGQGIYGPSLCQEDPSGHMTAESTASPQWSFYGEVVSVDPSSGTLTVKPINEASLNTLPERVTISTDKMTRINVCDHGTSLAFVNVGDKVNVQYHLTKGGYIAEGIDSAEQC